MDKDLLIALISVVCEPAIDFFESVKCRPHLAGTLSEGYDWLHLLINLSSQKISSASSGMFTVLMRADTIEQRLEDVRAPLHHQTLSSFGCNKTHATQSNIVIPSVTATDSIHQHIQRGEIH